VLGLAPLPRLHDAVRVGRRCGIVVTWRPSDRGRLVRVKFEIAPGAFALDVPGGDYAELLDSDPRLSLIPSAQVIPSGSDARGRVA
jgi:hypothetical protein